MTHTASNNIRCITLAYWYASESGYALQKRIADAMPNALSRVTGTEHVQVCEGTWKPLVEGARLVSYSDLFEESGMSFPRNSLDSIILVNTTDVAHQAQQVLHIADQLLTKSGTIAIVSFNPWGRLGIKHWVMKCLPKRLYRQSPWRFGFYTQSKLKDWLNVLNYEVRAFSLDVNKTAGVIKKMGSFLRKYGILPNSEPVTILVAKKPWFPMTGVKSGFKEGRIQSALAGIAMPKPSSTCEKGVSQHQDQ